MKSRAGKRDIFQLLTPYSLLFSGAEGAEKKGYEIATSSVRCMRKEGGRCEGAQATAAISA